MRMTIAKIGFAAWFVLTLHGCSTHRRHLTRVDAAADWNQMRSEVQQRIARQQFDSGAYEDAIVSISEAIALQPRNAPSYVVLAQANLELNRLASAQAALDAAARNDVTSSALTYMSGVILELRGDLQQAREAYESARSLDGDNVDYLVAEAECLVAMGRPEEALGLLDKHGDRLDNEGTIPALSAHIASLIGDARRAAEGYELAMIAHTGSARARRESAGREARAHDRPSAGRVGSVVVATEYSRLLMRRNEYGTALDVLSSLPAVSDGAIAAGSVSRAMATCQLALGDAGAALKTITPYVRDNPDDAMAQILLAKAAVSQDDVVTALQAIDSAAQRDPDRLELWLVRATVNWRRGRLAQAAAELYDLLQNAPDDVDARCLLAEVLGEQKRYQAARTQFERALQIDPECAWAKLGLKELQRVDEPKPVEQRVSSAKVKST